MDPKTQIPAHAGTHDAGPTNVITYSLPYDYGREVSLCRPCADRHPHLGQVQHGEHRDYCDGCQGEG